MHVTWQSSNQPGVGLFVYFQNFPDANPVSNTDEVCFDLGSVAEILALVMSMGSFYWSSDQDFNTLNCLQVRV